MRDNEKTKFYALIADVMSYYKQDTSEFMMGLFWDACKDLEFEQVSKAMNDHARDPDRGQFAPKVADIVRLLHGTSTDRAGLAWGKVYEAMCIVGSYTDVVFDDPAIHAAIADCGGWVKMCRCDFADLSYLQHRFCEAYKTYSKRGDFDFPRILNGDRSPDELYAKRGLSPLKPVLIGDKAKAKAVMTMAAKHDALQRLTGDL